MLRWFGKGLSPAEVIFERALISRVELRRGSLPFYLFEHEYSFSGGFRFEVILNRDTFASKEMFWRKFLLLNCFLVHT